MPKNINRVELQGHLGADAESRNTANGGTVCRFRIATTDRRKNNAGEWEDGDTHWHSITCFGKVAEFASELSKGECAHVEGKLTYRQYNDKWYTDIIAFHVSRVEKEHAADQVPRGPVDDDIPF